jgi:hypothetical protein
MFFKNKGVKELPTDNDLNEMGFVKCEHTKLWGRKEDMVRKEIRQFDYFGPKYVYFSPAFAPEWDICKKEVRFIKGTSCLRTVAVRYFKISPEKEVEIKIKDNKKK